MEKYGFGVDIGGTFCKIGLFSKNGILINKWEIPTDTSYMGSYILSNISNFILDKINQENIDFKDIIGIGVGIPGPVTSKGIVTKCVNLGWKDMDVSLQLELLTGLKVKVANDANVAALGEMWQGGAKGATDLIMVTLGTGVGGGIISDSKIISGYNGAGGEIGHICVNRLETQRCNCGKYGCLEQYVSATGIVNRTKKLIENNNSTQLANIKNITAKDVFDKAKENDLLAIEIVEETGDILGYALSNLACVTNPETIVIGGGVSKAGEILINTVEKYFKHAALFACRETKFALAQLGNDAGMYGCAKLIFTE